MNLLTFNVFLKHFTNTPYSKTNYCKIKKEHIDSSIFYVVKCLTMTLDATKVKEN